MKQYVNSLTEYFGRYWGVSYFWPVFIILAVYIFNYPYIFFDGLWHDDAYWFYQATEDNIDIGGLGKISMLAYPLSSFFSYGMLYSGTEFLHFIYVGIMAISSVFGYFFYRRVFCLRRVVAVPVATVPNILPSLIIPLGFNASYALWIMPQFFLTLIFLHKSFKSDDSRWYISYLLAFLFYISTLNSAAASTFLIPNTLLFFLLFIEKGRLSTVFKRSLPFIVYGLFHLYKHSLYSHKTVVHNSIDVVINRSQEFINMTNVYLVDKDPGVWVVMLLLVLGSIGFHINNNRFNVFEYGTIKKHKIFINLWLFCWLGSNSVVYLFFSPTFRPNDYAYVLNFGIVFLQIVGIMLCLQVLKIMFFSDLDIRKLSSVLIVFIVFFVGVQRIYGYHNSSLIKQIENTTLNIRELLSKVDIPTKSQMVLLNVKSPHPGVIDVNSGYVRYLTKRNDINALIGFDRYPLNPFKQKGSWLNPMSGLNKNRPIMSYRYTADGFERVNYMLQTVVNQSAKYPRLSWRLYDISKSQLPPVLVQEGVSVSEYKIFVDNYFITDVPFIAFSPGELPSRIISESEAKAIKSKGNILSHDVVYSGMVSLTNMQKVTIEGKPYAQVLIRINDISNRKFKIGYEFDRNTDLNIIDNSEYVLEGDHVLFYYPIAGINMMASEPPINFYNVKVWPYRKLEQKVVSEVVNDVY